MALKYMPGFNASKPGPSPVQILCHIAVWLYRHPEVEAEIMNDLKDTIFQEFYFTPEGGNRPMPKLF
jgi:hypothetical protein